MELANGNGSKYAPLPGKIPGTALNLGGHDFIVPPLNLNQVQHFGSVFESPPKADNFVQEFENALPIIIAAMQRNYPDFTEEDARALIDVGNFRDVVEAIVDSSGLVKAGEARPASQ